MLKGMMKKDFTMFVAKLIKRYNDFTLDNSDYILYIEKALIDHVYNFFRIGENENKTIITDVFRSILNETRKDIAELQSPTIDDSIYFALVDEETKEVIDLDLETLKIMEIIFYDLTRFSKETINVLYSMIIGR